MKVTLLSKLYLWMSSPKLTFFILVYSTALVFFSSLAQVDLGVAGAQAKYIESVVFLSTPLSFFGSFFEAIKIPMLGGATMGMLAVINIWLSCMRFARFGLQGFGVSITHMALVLLIVSAGLQYFMRTEGTLTLNESQPTNVVILPTKGVELKKIELPFAVELKKFTDEKWQGSDIPRNFASSIYFERNSNRIESVVSVNNPVSFGGWTFYQISYKNNGKTSVLSAVRNPARLLPWLSVCATFVGMLVIFVPRMLLNKDGRYER